MKNKDKHYTKEYFALNFISGLKNEIKYVMKLLKPPTLNEALSLAKFQESALTDLVPTNNTPFPILPQTTNNLPPVAQTILTSTFKPQNQQPKPFNQNQNYSNRSQYPSQT